LLMVVVGHEPTEDAFEETQLNPPLITRMNTTTGTEPFFMEGFPLAAGSQDMQDTVHHLPIRQGRSSRCPAWFVGRKEQRQLAPQVIGNRPQCVITHLTLLAERIGFAT